MMKSHDGIAIEKWNLTTITFWEIQCSIGLEETGEKQNA